MMPSIPPAVPERENDRRSLLIGGSASPPMMLSVEKTRTRCASGGECGFSFSS